MLGDRRRLRSLRIHGVSFDLFHRCLPRPYGRAGRMVRAEVGSAVVASCSVTVDPEVTYGRTTPGSRALHEKARAVMPGGTTRTTTYFDPYPLFVDRGEGCRIWDVDGTERIDMLGNYTALILGHAHPKVVEAIHRQAARGTGFAAANPLEVKLATLLDRKSVV